MNIVFQAVSKSFGPISALKDINFSVDDGEFVFIVGPSGAGKSTLLKLMINQVSPTSGQITIDNHPVNRRHRSTVEFLRKNIGVIFQDYLLIPDKTVEENIKLILDIISVQSSQMEGKVNQVLTAVNLLSRKHLFPSQLSGGELQRAALARALVTNPRVILADEPTGNLDPENAWNLIKLLKNINETNHTTIIMTTHNFEIINSLNKRTLTLNDGRLITDERPHPPQSSPSPEPKTKKVIHHPKHHQL